MISMLISMSHRCWYRVSGVSMGKLLQHPNLRPMADPATWVRAWPGIWWKNLDKDLNISKQSLSDWDSLWNLSEKENDPQWSMNHHESNERFMIKAQKDHLSCDKNSEIGHIRSRLPRSTLSWDSNSTDMRGQHVCDPRMPAAPFGLGLGQSVWVAQNRRGPWGFLWFPHLSNT